MPDAGVSALPDLTERRTLLTVGIPLIALGTLLFPAIFLTLSCSGSILNLRPDRIIGVIGECGPGYLLSVLLWILAGSVYLTGTVLTAAHAFFFAASLNGLIVMPSWSRPRISYPLLVGGIYLMHLFSWNLGLLYRRHQETFPWLLQRHIRTRKLLTVAPSAGTPTVGTESAPPAPVRPAPRPSQAAPLPVIPLPAEGTKPKRRN